MIDIFSYKNNLDENKNIRLPKINIESKKDTNVNNNGDLELINNK